MLQQPRKLKRLVIKEEFLQLTGDYISAIILHQFLYWSNYVYEADKLALAQWEKEKAGGRETKKPEMRNGWVWKSAKEMNEELLEIASDKTIERRIKGLIELGVLETRKNPNNQWDKTLQYRVLIPELQRKLQELGYALEGYPLLVESAPLPNRQDDESIQNDVDESIGQDDESVGQPVSPIGQNDESIGQNDEAITNITSKRTTKESFKKSFDDELNKKEGQAPPPVRQLNEKIISAFEEVAFTRGFPRKFFPQVREALLQADFLHEFSVLSTALNKTIKAIESGSCTDPAAYLLKVLDSDYDSFRRLMGDQV